jgi:hypothetical protein
MRVLRGRGAELEREFAFGVARQLFEPVLAGASVVERDDLLKGAAGFAARALGLPGAPSGALEESAWRADWSCRRPSRPRASIASGPTRSAARSRCA